MDGRYTESKMVSKMVSTSRIYSQTIVIYTILTGIAGSTLGKSVLVEICASDSEDYIIQCPEHNVVRIMERPDHAYLGYREKCREGPVKHEITTQIPHALCNDESKCKLNPQLASSLIHYCTDICKTNMLLFYYQCILSENTTLHGNTNVFENTTDPSYSNNSDKDSLSDAELAAIISVLLLLNAFFFGVMLYFIVKKRKQQIPGKTFEEPRMRASSEYYEIDPRHTNTRNTNVYSEITQLDVRRLQHADSVDTGYSDACSMQGIVDSHNSDMSSIGLENLRFDTETEARDREPTQVGPLENTRAAEREQGSTDGVRDSEVSYDISPNSFGSSHNNCQSDHNGVFSGEDSSEFFTQSVEFGETVMTDNDSIYNGD